MSEKKEEEKVASDDKRWWSEMVREFSLTGLAAFFMTEDSIRSYLKDLKLPKELVSILIENIGKKKDDFYSLLAKEFGHVISKVDLGKELSRFLERHRIHLEAKLSFEPKSHEEEAK